MSEDFALSRLRIFGGVMMKFDNFLRTREIFDVLFKRLEKLGIYAYNFTLLLICANNISVVSCI